MHENLSEINDDTGDSLPTAKAKNTKRQEEWALKIWRDWAHQRRQNASTSDNDKIPIEFDGVNAATMESAMCKFVLEVKNISGQDYTPGTLKCIVCAIYRHIKETYDYQGSSFLDRRNVVFKVINDKLTVMEEKGMIPASTPSGSSSAPFTIRKPSNISPEDEKLLWDRGVFQMNTSKGLLNTVYFYTSRNLGLRGRQDHRDLTMKQFTFRDNGTVRYLEFQPGPAPAPRQPGEPPRRKQFKSEPMNFYDTGDYNCYYRIVKAYADCFYSWSGPFYRKPLEGDRPRFSTHPVGVNTLAKLLKTMLDEAGITSNGDVDNEKNLEFYDENSIHRVFQPNVSGLVDHCFEPNIEYEFDDELDSRSLVADGGDSVTEPINGAKSEPEKDTNSNDSFPFDSLENMVKIEHDIPGDEATHEETDQQSDLPQPVVHRPRPGRPPTNPPTDSRPSNHIKTVKRNHLRIDSDCPIIIEIFKGSKRLRITF